MVDEPWVTPPPASHLNLVYSRFDWCQIQYVYANELARENDSIDFYTAYVEAKEVVDALKLTPTPMAPGATRNEVVWPILVCAANRYAVLPRERRAQERREIAAGKPIWSMGATVNQPELCDPAVMDDPEYQPVPPCVPRKVTSGLVIASGLLGGLVGTYLCLSVVLSTPERP